jgi:hypothetical protein
VWIQTWDLWIKSQALYQCSYRGAETHASRYNAYIAIFITKVPGLCSIFRHNKNSKFYRTVNIRRLMVNFLILTTELWQKPWSCYSGKRITLTKLQHPVLIFWIYFNPFTAEVAIMRLLGSAPLSHLCDQRRRSKVAGLSDLMTLFIDLGCLNCKQTQKAFNVFKYTLNWLKIDSVDQKFNWLECGNFSQDCGTPGIAFSQLAVKGLNCASSCNLQLFSRRGLRIKMLTFVKM